MGHFFTLVIFAIIALPIVSPPVYASDLAVGQNIPFSVGNYTWRYEESGSLFIQSDVNPKTLAHYDLSDCMFCSGDEDNCQKDGIRSFRLTQTKDEPLLLVACHIGAHSQKLQIFAPLRDRANPVQVTVGAYYVDYEIKDAEVLIRYDKYNPEGAPTQHIYRWPDEVQDDGRN